MTNQIVSNNNNDAKSLPIFIPLFTTHINWNDYLKTANSIRVKQDTVRTSEDAAFLKTLINLKYQSISLFRSAGLEKHLFCSYLIANLGQCDTIVKFTEAQLDVSDLGEFLIVSGTLDRWILFITNNSNLNVRFEIRVLANCVFMHLQRLGLEPLFSKWAKKICNDGTTTLIPN